VHDNIIELALANLALVLACLNVPLWSGTVATGVFRWLHNRDVRQYRATIRSLEANILNAHAAEAEASQLARMDADARDKHLDAVRVVKALLQVQADARSMSLSAATQHGMTRTDWERARHLLQLAQVIALDGNGSAHLIIPASVARQQALDYLAGLRNYPSYVYP